jgi:LacI family transcriptional regulator
MACTWANLLLSGAFPIVNAAGRERIDATAPSARRGAPRAPLSGEGTTVSTDAGAPSRPRPPTIRDVAHAAGVSVGTASKALNGQGRLRAETRERVLREAERLEFRPNDLIKSLLRGRTYTVGMITTDYFGRFNMPVVAGIEDALGAAEILVFLCNVRDDPDRERKVVASLLAKQVDGIIVMGRRTDPRPPLNVGRSGVPVVYAFSSAPDPDALCLLPDDAQGARLATDHLLRVGRHRLAHITGPAEREAVRLRREGMTAVLAEHGLPLPTTRVLSGDWTEDWGYEAIGRLLERDRRVDAIFCGSDIIARGVIDGLRERGRRVPDDVAVVGFDNWDILATQTRPPLTTVDMNLHDLGREAARRLLARVDGARESGIVRLPCSLVVRASSGALAPSEAESAATEPTLLRA